MRLEYDAPRPVLSTLPPVAHVASMPSDFNVDEYYTGEGDSTAQPAVTPADPVIELLERFSQSPASDYTTLGFSDMTDCTPHLSHSFHMLGAALVDTLGAQPDFVNQGRSHSPSAFLAAFDLNQWSIEQMAYPPPSISEVPDTLDQPGTWYR